VDILTAKGQQSLSDERVVAQWVESHFQFQYIETPKDSPALIDAILIGSTSNELKGVIETKCRYKLTLEQFKTSFKNEWLVTWDKVHNAIQIANSLGVPCFGFLYLVNDKYLLIQKLSEPNGKLNVKIRLETTETQATINGGKAIRTNAFIDMSSAHIYNLKE
jgi:hypothetical protein